MTNARAPYGFEWKTGDVSDGEHILQARAWDEAENEGRSAEVHVIVGNRDMTTIQRPASTGFAPAVTPTPKVAAPIIPAPGPTRERAALPVPAPVVHQAQPVAPPVVSSVNSGTARLATARATDTRVAALPKTSTVTGGRPSRTAVGETVASADSALAMMSSAGPSWTRVAARTAPRAEGVQLAYQVSTPLGAVARTMAEAATMACAPVAAQTAPSTRPSVSAPSDVASVQTSALPERTASLSAHETVTVEIVEAPLSPAELALAPRAPEVYVTALMPPMPGTAHEAGPAPAAEPQVVSLDAATEVVKGVRVGSLAKIIASSGGVLTWYPAEKRMHCVTPQVTMDLRLGQTMARVNGEVRTLELAPFVHNGEAMVPLSFLADALGLTITFDATHGRLIIGSKAK
jgi:hypothetical protein